MKKTLFGVTKSNEEVFCYSLFDNKNYVNILNYGATIQSLVIKNKNNEFVDVVLGFDNISQYEQEKNRTFMGAVCGRYANRIAHGCFYINGQKYNLAKNDNGNCLHGGKNGFDKCIFQVDDFTKNSITLSLLSKDGDSGFPGDLLLKVKYTFKDNTLTIEYFATTTKDCPVNITNHSYFNLMGKGDILTHKLQLNSNYYMDTNVNGLANGNIVKTALTPFDFSTCKEINEATKFMDIDHHFYINPSTTYHSKLGTLIAPDNSLSMDIYTDQCGAQIYTGNSIVDNISKCGAISKYSGICFETQSVPNAMEFSYLPSPILKVNEQYSHRSDYKFY